MMEGSVRSGHMTGRCHHLYKNCRLREPLACRRNGGRSLTIIAFIVSTVVKGSVEVGVKGEAWGRLWGGQVRNVQDEFDKISGEGWNLSQGRSLESSVSETLRVSS